MGIGNPELIKKAKYRREQILQHVDKSGGITGMKLAEMYGVTKGTILKDIAELRRQGYPIQVSSHIEEGGMIVAVYEIPQMLQRSTKDISAASVE